MALSKDRHPQYSILYPEWQQSRDAYNGGTDYIHNYSYQLQGFETDSEFNIRKNLSYVPIYVAAVVTKVTNSISAGMVDAFRTDINDRYLSLLEEDIDGRGRDIDTFITTSVLKELLITAKVGIMCDGEVSTEATASSNAVDKAFFKIVPAENIYNWSFTRGGKLKAVAYTENITTENEQGLAKSTYIRYNNLYLKDGILHHEYNALGKNFHKFFRKKRTIPMSIIELNRSVIKDIALHQKSLLNLASSDLFLAARANIPVYTEQGDKNTILRNMSNSIDPLTGEETHTRQGRGMTEGILYSPDSERPAFISAPSDPISSSLAKQDSIIKEIWSIVNLNLASLGNDGTVESGLTNIGGVLEGAERAMLSMWYEYEGITDEDGIISYPKTYSLKSTIEILDEVDKLIAIVPSMPSLTARQKTHAIIASKLLKAKVSAEDFSKITDEIDNAPLVGFTVKQIISLLENNTINKQLVADGYNLPKDCVALANEEHAEKLARISASQLSMPLAQARGVSDLSGSHLDGKNEKAVSQDASLNDGAKTRGDGK